MSDAIEQVIDLRRIESHLIHSTIAQRVAHTAADESFWMIADHDPVELHDFLIDLGLTVQTFIISEKEFRVFLGKIA
jgi:uncharacterized protein (DUF2249 family)